ncbi:uncharacterized protein [Nicotiana tomentosiformis]|uniref:uncharacterized protein n=1 Tax=Nicotiana tomentosiformis TaxID=4098 RepID=UPI00388C7D15
MGIDTSCCHANEGKEKSDDLPLAPSSEKLIESTPQEVNACEKKVTFTNGDLLLGDTFHNRPLYLVGYMRDERVNRILVDGGSLVNILPIRTVKELGIPMNELSESRVMIQGFNQGGQRAIGAIRLEIIIEDMQSSEVEKKIIADDEPFTEAESHFADAKFYLKNRIVKELKVDDVMNDNDDESTDKRAEVVADKTKVVAEKVHPNPNKSHKGNIVSHGVNSSDQIEAVKSSSMPLARFVAQNCLQNVALPTKRTDEGKLPSEAATRQLREGLGYKQLSPVCISIRRASNNYITAEDESAASNKPFVFDLLGKSTVRTSVFERLGPLKKGNKFQRNFQSIRTPVSPKIQKISKDFQSLIPSRMRRQTKLLVSCKEVLKVNPYTVAHTKEHDEDKESVGSSYHVTVQGENGVPSSMEDNAELEDVSLCYHISFNDGDPQEDEDAKDAPPKLEEGVKATIDALKEVNLSTDEEPRPTYLKMPGLDPKVAVHHLAVKNGTRPVKQAQRKKNGQIRVCVHFRDLNNACPKDEFPLPIPELMIDDTTGYEAMSFMDGSSGYNQIRMAPKDEELTAFHTPKGIYCYKLPILAAPILGKPLILYISAQERYVGALLAQENSEGKENSLYYLSRRMTPNEMNYSPIEKLCLALVFSIQKLKHYFQAHVVRLVSKVNPIKFVMSKPIFSDRLVRWYLQFQQFEILYISQKAVKGQALADLLAYHPIPDDWELTDELPYEDTMVVEVQPL